MLKCKSDKCNEYGICVCEADAQQLNGGDISCDIAEDCDYNKEIVMNECQYAKLDNVKDV